MPISEIDLCHVPGVITLLFADSTFERLNIGRLEYCFRKKNGVGVSPCLGKSLRTETFPNTNGGVTCQMIAQTFEPKDKTTNSDWIKLISIAVSLLLFANVADAGFSVLSGVPITQGQMRLNEHEFEQVKIASPNASPCFILEETRVDVEISGVLARVRVSQVFKNPYSSRLEASYVFPMPENCAVDAYSFQIGERVVIGEVKEKEEARKVYQQARKDGRKAALLEQERANVFTQSIANIPPKSMVVVNIEYVHPLEIDENRCLFRYPMTVAPRYIPGTPKSRPNVGRGWATDTDQVPDASRITTDVLPAGMRNGNDVFVTVKIDGGMPIQNIIPVTHELDIQKTSETEAVVTLKNQSTIADKDFVIEYQLAGENSTLASLVHRKSEETDGYVMLALQPKWSVEPTEITPRQVHLVLDTSGSMNGVAISQLRQFAEHVLDHLNPQDEFQLIAFNNQSRAFRANPVSANSVNIEAGKQFVRGLSAGGGTKLLPALQLALGDECDESTPPRYLFLMSDALVGNDHSILRYIQDAKFQDGRVFPIAFGAAPNDYLINRAAELGRGFSLQVTNQDNAPALASRFNELTSLPYMTDIQIDWGGLSVRDQVPGRLPDLYAGKPLVVLGRFDQAGSRTITLKGNVLGQPVEMKLELELPIQESSHDSIASVWARQRIRQIWNRDVGNETTQGRSEITKLGLSHQLVTQYTSFVAVEKELSEVPEGNLVSEVVPSMMPDGMTAKPNGSQRTTARSAPQPPHASGNPLSSATQPAAGISQPAAGTSQPVASKSSSHVVSSQATSPSASSSPGYTRKANDLQSGSSGGSSGASGGGPIGPVTAVFSIIGAGAAAMMRRKKAERKTEPKS
ncbi:VIT and VWA domain-containing protein [bacterium]|nr:VIT and VWA domain-containing protein [bacterium]